MSKYHLIVNVDAFAIAIVSAYIGNSIALGGESNVSINLPPFPSTNYHMCENAKEKKKKFKKFTYSNEYSKPLL